MVFFGTAVVHSPDTEPPSLPPRPQCDICGMEGHLTRCTSCEVVCYCGRDHQTSAEQFHRASCDKVQEARTIWDSRPWFALSERYRVIEALSRIRTRDAVQTTLDYCLSMLRDSSCYSVGTLRVVPASYIRLGRAEDAYNFIRWWYKRSEHGCLDFGILE